MASEGHILRSRQNDKTKGDGPRAVALTGGERAPRRAMRCEEKHGYVGLSVHHSLCTLGKPLDCTKGKAWRRADAALGWGMGRRQGSVSLRRRRIIRTIHSPRSPYESLDGVTAPSVNADKDVSPYDGMKQNPSSQRTGRETRREARRQRVGMGGRPAIPHRPARGVLHLLWRNARAAGRRRRSCS